MTYPQQYPPQGYGQPAPQQPQYGAPQGTPWMPPQYGGQMPPTAAPKLGESGKGGGGATAPAPRHLIGRTVIIEPIRIDETTTAKDQQGNTVSRPTAHYHLTVVDGGPLQYGDNRDHDISKQHGMTMQVDTPCRFTNVQSDRYGIVNEVRDTLARGEMASVGVIQQGTRGNKPFLMTKCGRDLEGNERPDGAERFERATQVWNAVFAKTFISPEPRSLVAPPAQQPQQVAYQPTAAGYAQQGVYAPQPAYNPGPAPQQYGFQPHPNGPDHGPQDQNGYYVPQQSAPPAPPSAQQGYGQNPAFEAWLATLPPEQQAAQRAALAGQQQSAGPGF